MHYLGASIIFIAQKCSAETFTLVRPKLQIEFREIIQCRTVI